LNYVGVFGAPEEIQVVFPEGDVVSTLLIFLARPAPFEDLASPWVAAQLVQLIFERDLSFFVFVMPGMELN